jgi:hypothetical protein
VLDLLGIIVLVAGYVGIAFLGARNLLLARRGGTGRGRGGRAG